MPERQFRVPARIDSVAVESGAPARGPVSARRECVACVWRVICHFCGIQGRGASAAMIVWTKSTLMMRMLRAVDDVVEYVAGDCGCCVADIDDGNCL